MDKMKFIHQEIKHTLNIIGYFSDNERAQMLDSIKDSSYKELVKLLKKLYKVERQYFEFRLKDAKNTEEFLQTLKPTHE